MWSLQVTKRLPEIKNPHNPFFLAGADDPDYEGFFCFTEQDLLSYPQPSFVKFSIFPEGKGKVGEGRGGVIFMVREYLQD